MQQCPPHIAAAIAADHPPTLMLQAIKRINPARICWLGQPEINVTLPNSPTDFPTAWSLDGKRATLGQILAAANMPALL